MINLKCEMLCIYNNDYDECICPEEVRLYQSPWAENGCNQCYCNNFQFDKDKYGEDNEKGETND